MQRTFWIRSFLVLSCLAGPAQTARSQTFRASFDAGVNADQAVGRAEPWEGRDWQAVPGKFGMAVQLGERGGLIYAGEQNVLAGRGTLACWCRIPARPGPADIQRLVWVQCKERGYWNYLATMEWQESAFRAMVFDFSHGHGWHDPDALPAFDAGKWHHLALVWDQAEGARFYLDGQLAGSTWGQQAWWERPTPHAIHLVYPGAAYDELCVYDRALTAAQVAGLMKDNRCDLDRPAVATAAALSRLHASLGLVGLEDLPALDPAAQRANEETVIRQAKLRQVLDDRIPSWKVVDGRMDLFWPEWRSPTLGDVDFSGSEIAVALEPGQEPTHLVLRGQVGGCRVHGARHGYVSSRPIAEVPAGLHQAAARQLPPGLTGLRVPRREGMRLHEIGIFTVGAAATAAAKPGLLTPLAGPLAEGDLGAVAVALRTRMVPEERVVLGSGGSRGEVAVPGLRRIHFLTDPVREVVPLDALHLRLAFTAPWKEDVWWLRVQDPVNPRRDLMNVPVRVLNPHPGKEATVAVTLDFWDIMLEPGTRLWVELLPTQDVKLLTRDSHLVLRPGDRAQVLEQFAHTQSQLAFSYWQLASEASGTQGSDPNRPSFNLLGGITQGYELKLTLEWLRRHVEDNHLANGLWKITFDRRGPVAVTPRLRPEGAPEWAIWGRELLERFRAMSHHWADWQGPDGQIGGGWNDDTDFPGVFICLPLLGDMRTQQMFTRIFDGLERTGYLHNSVARGPIDTLHATDFLSWRAHLMLFDYGEPRHIERALDLTRELDRWTRLDDKGHRRAVAHIYSEDGPQRQPRSKVNDDGSIEQLAPFKDGSIAQFTRDAIYCAWYARNPAVMKFVREVAEGDYARAAAGERLGLYTAYPFFSYYTLFNDPKYLAEPVDAALRDRWALPIWRRFAERLPNGDRFDAQLIKAAKVATASDESLTAAYVATRDRAYLVRALRGACENLEGGWQFRGGEARGANDHFFVPGQAALSQLYLGSALTWVRPASIVPPIAVSWRGLDADVAAMVLEAAPERLRVAAFNFDRQPRAVQMRVWELTDGQYRLREGIDADGDDRIDGPAATRDLALRRGDAIALQLPPGKVQVIELELNKARHRPEHLPDLAVGRGDIAYDLATDRLKVTVHNLGAAAARNVAIRFEAPDGRVLGRAVIPHLDAPLDLRPKTAVVALPQPTLHPVDRIIVRVDPDDQIEEICEDNNRITWER